MEPKDPLASNGSFGKKIPQWLHLTKIGEFHLEENLSSASKEYVEDKSPYPGRPDGRLPIESQNVFDPLETLTYVLATEAESMIEVCFRLVE